MSNPPLSGPDLILESRKERERSQTAVDRAVAAGERVRALIDPGLIEQPRAPRPGRKPRAPRSS